LPEIRVDDIGDHIDCFVPGARSLVTAGMPGVTSTSQFRDPFILPPVLKAFLPACLMHASL
jgi:hypothetical protein